MWRSSDQVTKDFTSGHFRVGNLPVVSLVPAKEKGVGPKFSMSVTISGSLASSVGTSRENLYLAPAQQQSSSTRLGCSLTSKLEHAGPPKRVSLHCSQQRQPKQRNIQSSRREDSSNGSKFTQQLSASSMCPSMTGPVAFSKSSSYICNMFVARLMPSTHEHCLGHEGNQLNPSSACTQDWLARFLPCQTAVNSGVTVVA